LLLSLGEEEHIRLDHGDGGESREDHESDMYRVFWLIFQICLSPDDGFQIIMIITVGINFLYDYIITI
jgi:hypothetical protein